MTYLLLPESRMRPELDKDGLFSRSTTSSAFLESCDYSSDCLEGAAGVVVVDYVGCVTVILSIQNERFLIINLFELPFDLNNNNNFSFFIPMTLTETHSLHGVLGFWGDRKSVV